MSNEQGATPQEYLLSYGVTGEFGRFRPTQPLRCRRGDRAVIRTHRGLELGVVMCAAQPGHARFLPNTSIGELLRLATPEDTHTAAVMSDRSQNFFEDCRRLVAEMALPLEILDAEVLLDGRQAIFHYLRWAECDERSLVSSLCRQHDVFVAMHNLRTPAEMEGEESDHGGCGEAGCGNKGGSGCTSCATGCSLSELLGHKKHADTHPHPMMAHP